MLGQGVTERVVWHVVKQYAAYLDVSGIALENWNKSSFYSGMFQSRPPSVISAANNEFAQRRTTGPAMDHSGPGSGASRGLYV